MSDDLAKKNFDVTELDEATLDAVSGGVGDFLELVDNVDALGCKDNGNCPSCTTNSGNCIAGCT